MTTASQKRAAEKRAAEEAAKVAAEAVVETAPEGAAQAAPEGALVDQGAGAGADVEQDVEGAADAEEGAQAPSRADTLARFATGETPEPEPEPATVESVDTSAALNWGGDRLAVVLFGYFAAKVDGRYRRVEKGTVIRATDELVDYGVKLGALKELEG